MPSTPSRPTSRSLSFSRSLSLGLGLALSLLLLAGTALAQPQPVPAGPVQVPVQVGTVAVPVVVPCDEPAGVGPCMVPPPMVVPTSIRPPWTFQATLGVTSGVTAGSVLFGPTVDAAPYVGGDLRLRWSRLGRPWGLGIRLSGLGTVNARGRDFAFFSDNPTMAASFWGAEAGFLFDTHGFWVSGGFGVAQYTVGPVRETYPELTAALGYDISLGRFVALRLHTAVHSLIYSTRAEAGGGLVFKF